MTEQFYEKRVVVFPRSVSGRFRSLKYAVLALAYGVYFLLPFLRWERVTGPDQAVLFDIAGRRFYLFDLVVYAQDIFWLAGILVIAAFLLFFVTGLAGRAWCGYFCFQTLWTDVFMLIEKIVQGDRNARIKLYNSPMNFTKLSKIAVTRLLWLMVAFFTGLAFTLYWADAFKLIGQMLAGEAPFAAYATTIFLTLTTFVMAGLAREQVCTYMCPYARFQGVMYDRDTLVIAYDEKRGEREEGRRKPRKGMMDRNDRIAANVGDCIDCGYCVQVCPTGIDIRNGLQYQCISCGLCIDACNTIMDSINYPRGLIRYTSQHALEEKPTRLLKAKNIGYGVGLLLAVSLLVWSVAHRTEIELQVRQVRQPLYVVMSDGRIQNRYEIKINNKLSEEVHYSLSVRGLPSAELDAGAFTTFNVHAEHSIKLMVMLRQPPGTAEVSDQEFEFIISPVDGQHAQAVKKSVFFVPEKYLKK